MYFLVFHVINSVGHGVSGQSKTSIPRGEMDYLIDKSGMYVIQGNRTAAIQSLQPSSLTSSSNYFFCNPLIF